MSQLIRASILAVLSLYFAGCATPSPIKEISTLQVEAFKSTRESVDSYVALVDKEIVAIQALEDGAHDVNSIAQAVAKAVDDPALDDPGAAIKALPGLVSAERSGADEAALVNLRKQHKQQLNVLKSILIVLEQNQALVDRYLQTDIGPDPAKLSELNTELAALDELIKKVQEEGDGR